MQLDCFSTQAHVISQVSIITFLQFIGLSYSRRFLSLDFLLKLCLFSEMVNLIVHLDCSFHARTLAIVLWSTWIWNWFEYSSVSVKKIFNVLHKQISDCKLHVCFYFFFYWCVYILFCYTSLVTRSKLQSLFI